MGPSKKTATYWLTGTETYDTGSRTMRYRYFWADKGRQYGLNPSNETKTASYWMVPEYLSNRTGTPTWEFDWTSNIRILPPPSRRGGF